MQITRSNKTNLQRGIYVISVTSRTHTYLFHTEELMSYIVVSEHTCVCKRGDSISTTNAFKNTLWVNYIDFTC